MFLNDRWGIGTCKYAFRESYSPKYSQRISEGIITHKIMDVPLFHMDISPGDMQQKLGAESLDVEDTLSFVIAAIRETFEEAGVLLANKKENIGSDLESLLEQRDDHLDSGWFKSFITTANWMLAVSKLYRWSHWITPRLMKLRFDTRFFLALMPENQACRPDRKETTEGRWVTPKEGMTGNLSGEIPLSPPAVVILHDLLAYPCMDDLMKAASQNPLSRIDDSFSLT